MTIQINDPWFENIYNTEFEGNSSKFLETIKNLLIEKNQKEKKVIKLLKEYQESKISLGKIAQNLNITKEEALSILEKNSIDFVDYSWEEEKKNIHDFLLEVKDNL